MHLADQNLRSLSDEDLIRHFCAHREDQGAAAELWKRHGETIRTFVKRHGKLRPRACPYETFVDATFSRAYLNFLARICRFRFQGSFEGWLGKVALTAA